MKELTIELTNYYPDKRKICSSDVTSIFEEAKFISMNDVLSALISNGNEEEKYDRINILGGEPFSHPKFHDILTLCEMFSEYVAVYSDEFRNLIDSAYGEAKVTISPDPDVDKVHVLKNSKPGRSKNLLEVQFSKNWTTKCNKICEHTYIRQNGEKVLGPCNKWNKTPAEENNQPTEAVLERLKQMSFLYCECDYTDPSKPYKK
jgi:organic radical activating enzyme